MRVTKWEFAPGTETGWRRHERDDAVMTLTSCSFLPEEPERGIRRADMEVGAAYGRDEGVEREIVDGATRRWGSSRSN